MVDSPSLGTFKVRLGGVLSSLVWLKMSGVMAGVGIDINNIDIKGPLQPKLFCDSVNQRSVVWQKFSS